MMENNRSDFLRMMLCTIVAGGMLGVANDASGSYCTSEGCVVTPPPGWGDVGGGGGGNGGDWGGNSTYNPCDTGEINCNPPDIENKCNELRLTKPASCPNPIPYPSGHSYAGGDFPGGSGMARLIYFADHRAGVAPAARDQIKYALSEQTAEFSFLFRPFNDTMETMVSRLTEACATQRNWTSQSSPVLSAADKDCVVITDRIIAEANNRSGFWNWFVSWSGQNGINLSDLGLPQSVIDILSPQNSVRIKYERVVDDAICSNWWQRVEFYQCSI